jgi:tetratricopeptide (TPR) repeat protein
MRLAFPVAMAMLLWAGLCFAQQAPSERPDTNDAPPRSAQSDESPSDPNVSSSRDTRIDISPPKNDSKDHPESNAPGFDDAANPSADGGGDVTEAHVWNPYRATKDDEVGLFYMKRHNYKAALARYQDALASKDNYAIAHFRMAQCFEKLDQPQEAVEHYKAYLKILPHGPFAKDAEKSLARLQKTVAAK